MADAVESAEYLKLHNPNVDVTIHSGHAPFVDENSSLPLRCEHECDFEGTFDEKLM